MSSEAFITSINDAETAALDLLFNSDTTAIKSATSLFQNANRKKPSVIVTENASGLHIFRNKHVEVKEKKLIQTYEHDIYSFLRKHQFMFAKSHDN